MRSSPRRPTVVWAEGAYPSAVTGWFTTFLAALRRDPEAVLERCEHWIGDAQVHGMTVFVPYMRVCRGWAVAVRDDVDLGLAEMEEAAAQIAATGARMLNNVFHGLKADALLVADRPTDALVSADEALRLVERSGERWFEAELHRLRGRALLTLDADDPAGEDAIRTALAIATAQGSLTSRRGRRRSWRPWRRRPPPAQGSGQATIS